MRATFAVISRSIISIVILTGCAAPQWSHDSKTPQDWHRDAYECDRDGAAVRDEFWRADMWRRCMEVRGWRRS